MTGDCAVTGNSPSWIATPDDARGMQRLLRLLPGDPAREAAALLRDASERVVVCTGFPVGGLPESDGPPGALELARALERIGQRVAIASWRRVLELVAPWALGIELVEVPCGMAGGNRPLGGMIVAVEACGRAADGCWRNMRGEDISADVPRFEDRVGERLHVAVGDGGNELGMGSAPETFFDGLPFPRPVSTAQVLVPSTVSNWGALAIVAELSLATRRRLLPDPEQHAQLVRDMIADGAVDGFSRERVDAVDGRPLAESVAVVTDLQGWLVRAMSS